MALAPLEFLETTIFLVCTPPPLRIFQVIKNAAVQEVISRVDTLRRVRVPLEDVVVARRRRSGLLRRPRSACSDLLRSEPLSVDSVAWVHLRLLRLIHLHLHPLLLRLPQPE